MGDIYNDNEDNDKKHCRSEQYWYPLWPGNTHGNRHGKGYLNNIWNRHWSRHWNKHWSRHWNRHWSRHWNRQWWGQSKTGSRKNCLLSGIWSIQQ